MSEKNVSHLNDKATFKEKKLFIDIYPNIISLLNLIVMYVWCVA